MSAFRNLKVSKFRHAYGQPAKRENCYEGMRITTSAHDSQFCTVNPKFIAVVLEVAGGGAFQVVPIKMVGKIDYNYGRIKGHNGPINDLKWNPFDDNVIATCSDDCTVKLWLIPEEGVKSSTQTWLCQMTGHSRRVGHLEWHPTASNVLVSAGFDFKIFIWNASSGECLMSMEHHQDVIYSLSFSSNGSLLATTSKDRMLRVFNLRRGEILHNDLTQPLIRSEIDSSAGVLHPFYDCDLNILYLAGKGDGNIRFYEILDSLPYVQFLNEFQSRFPQRSFGVMPKRALDVNQCEIFRFYKVHTIQTILEPVSIIVPRKNEVVRAELYPLTAGPVPSCNVDDWLLGINKDPIKILITDNIQQKRLQGNFNPSSSGMFGRDRLMSPTSELKFQFLSHNTRPDYRPLSDVVTIDKPPMSPTNPSNSSSFGRNPLSPTFEAKFQFLTQITKPDYRPFTTKAGNSKESKKDHTEKRLLDVSTTADKKKKEEEKEIVVVVDGTTTTRNNEEDDIEKENIHLNQNGKENLPTIDVDDENGEVSDIINNRRPPSSSEKKNKNDNDDDGRTSVNIPPNKIPRLCQSPLSSPELETCKSPSTLIKDCTRRCSSSNYLRTRSASPMSPVQIQSGLDEIEARKLVKPQPLHFNGTVGHKPPTKPGLITPGPIIRRNDGSNRAKPFRVSQSQPPTPRPDSFSSGLDKLESGIVDKIFAQQSKTMRELFEENYVKDKRIEQLESEVSRLSIKIEQLNDDLKQKQDDVDSLRYEIAWKDRRVVQLEQQLYKHIANVGAPEV